MKNKKLKSIPKEDFSEYETTDFSETFASGVPLRLEDIGVALPSSPPSQVVSIRLPTPLLNQIRYASSERDIPYQALIKLLLGDGIKKYLKRSG